MPVENQIAHVKQLPSGEWREHSLEEHLKMVTSGAGSAAAHFGAEEWGFLAGLWQKNDNSDE